MREKTRRILKKLGQLRPVLETAAICVVAALFIITAANLTSKVLAAEAVAGDGYPSLFSRGAEEQPVLSQKTVYLTFDDGPSKNTAKILDVLKEQGVKATFFVCSQKAVGVDEPEMYRRILDEGHEIGLHSLTHRYGEVYASLDSYLKDLSALNEYIIESTGYRPSVVRFPGGSGSTQVSPGLMEEIIGEMTRRGYRYYDWDVESGDQTAEVRSADYLCERIVTGAQNTGGNSVIVLLHDSVGPTTTPEAVRLAIPILRDLGFAFDTLSRGAG